MVFVQNSSKHFHFKEDVGIKIEWLQSRCGAVEVNLCFMVISQKGSYLEQFTEWRVNISAQGHFNGT